MPRRAAYEEWLKSQSVSFDRVALLVMSWKSQAAGDMSEANSVLLWLGVVVAREGGRYGSCRSGEPTIEAMSRSSPHAHSVLCVIVIVHI